jgi:hypothetical protein
MRVHDRSSAATPMDFCEKCFNATTQIGGTGTNLR